MNRLKHRAAEFSTLTANHEKVLGYFLARLCERDPQLAEIECAKLYSYGDRPMLSVETVEEYRKEIYRIASFCLEDDSALIVVEVMDHKSEVVRGIEKVVPAKEDKPEVFEEQIVAMVNTACRTIAK